jgi:hypothetical protein
MTVYLFATDTARSLYVHLYRVGQNRISATYMTVCRVISRLKIPYVHRIYLYLYGSGQPYIYMYGVGLPYFFKYIPLGGELMRVCMFVCSINFI